MVSILWGVAYLVVHLTAYFVYARDLPVARTEKGIFLYHSVSAVLSVTLLFITSLPSGWEYATTVAICFGAAHGIYSLSFLEVWSLSQGSYSFQVLEFVHENPDATTERVVSALAATGERKKSERLDALERLQLVRRSGDRLELSWRGRTVSSGLRALLWLCNLSDTG